MINAPHKIIAESHLGDELEILISTVFLPQREAAIRIETCIRSETFPDIDGYTKQYNSITSAVRGHDKAIQFAEDFYFYKNM